MSTNEAPTRQAPSPDQVLFEMEELDLSPYEARVLLALLRLGAANTAQMSRESGVPRTSTYQILGELVKKGLAEPLSVDGPAMWASPGRDEVFERLNALQEEKLRQHQARTARLRKMIELTYPQDESPTGPYVHVIQGASRVTQIYDRLVKSAQSELLVFNRPPYSSPSHKVMAVVLDCLDRGVRARVLYESAHWYDPSASRFRDGMETYHRAGVQGRLVAELPLKLAVVDRRAALLAMSDPVLPEIGFPVTMLVEHPGYSALQADAFQYLWERSEEIR